MDNNDNRGRAAEARKQALKELLEGVAMVIGGIVVWLLGGDLNFVEGVTTRYESRSFMYLKAAGAGLIFVGAVLLITGLVHLAKSGRGGGKRGQ